MTVKVSEKILTFLHFTKEELKLKEELPWLSRTSTPETIANLNVKCGQAHQGQLKVQFSLLWQVHITNITINNQKHLYAGLKVVS